MADSDPQAGEGEGGEKGSSTGFLLVAAILLAAGIALFLMGDAGSERVVRGSSAPDFDLAALDPEAPHISLGSLDGRVVLVNFWATWCKPCEDEMPAMERLYQLLRPEGFELIAISVDTNTEGVARFRERLGIGFPIALDPDQVAARAYQTTGFPESLLIDRDGKVVERYVGPREWDHSSHVERIRRLLAGG